jgi:hypothetical protein
MLNDRLLADQGLPSRFLITAPESAAGLRVWHELSPASEIALKRYGACLLDILEAPLPLVAGKANEFEPRRLALSAGARGLWIAFADHIERAIAPNGALEPVRGLANKLPEHAARLAAILALVDDLGAPEIGANHMRAGIALAEHYATEALRLFGASRVNSELRLAQRLLDWLLGAWSEPAISQPNIYQRSLNAIGDKVTAAKLVAILEDHGWLVRIPEGAVAPTGCLARRSGDLEMSAYRKFIDTLQSEPRIPAPPKAPKAHPSEPVSLPVLGGLGTLGAPPIKNEISLHAATPPPVSFSARAVLDDLRPLPMASVAAKCRLPAQRSSPQANGWNASHYRRRASRDFLSRGRRGADG